MKGSDMPTEAAVPAEGDITSQAEAFVGRWVGAGLGTFDLFTVYLGDRLGLYGLLAQSGPLTTGEVATKTGTGTVMRAGKLAEYARKAGFDGVDVLPFEPGFLRFYRLKA